MYKMHWAISNNAFKHLLARVEGEDIETFLGISVGEECSSFIRRLLTNVEKLGISRNLKNASVDFGA